MGVSGRRLAELLAGLGLVSLLAACGAGAPEGQTAVSPQTVSPLPAFVDVSATAGLDGFTHETGAFGARWFPETMGSGCAFVDVNGDGYLDVLLAAGYRWPGHGDPPPAIIVYRNNGDGTFTDVTEAMGLAEVKAYAFGFAASDYDNDGDQDVFVTTVGENLFLRNDGASFARVEDQIGLAGHDEWSTSAMFLDADRDGWNDLLYVNYVEWSPDKDIPCTLEGKTRTYCTPELYEGTAPRFFLNNGDGTFSEASETAGFRPASGKSLGVAALDFDRNGWIDVLVANDTQPDELFRNLGDGTFEEVGLTSGIAFDENGKARGGMGVDAGIVDASDNVSTFVGNFSKEMIGVYRYLGNGLFIDRAATSRIGRTSLMTLTFSVFLFDVDLDGDLDLFAGNGHLQPEIEETVEGITYREEPHLFVNQGDGTFVDVAPQVGGVLEQSLLVRGSAFGDYDQDGDLDVLAVENGGPVHLWRNDVDHGGFVRITLRGTVSNRDALGAEVIGVAGDRRMHRLVRTGSSYLSQSERTVTFGLGDKSVLDSLIVTWPAGGREAWTRLESGAKLTLEEGAGVPLR